MTDPSSPAHRPAGPAPGASPHAPSGARSVDASASGLSERLVATLARAGSDPFVRCLALAHGASCIGRFDAVELLYRHALERGVALPRLEETALQVVAYGGFPRAIEGLSILARLRGGPAASSAEGPGDRPGATLEEDPALPPSGARARAGRRTWNAVYAHKAADVLATLEGLVPGFSSWVLQDAYGRILSRPGLDLGERELLAVSALGLAALGTPLDSHVRGALRNGSTEDAVDDILRDSLELADPRAQAVIAQARDRLARKVYRP